MNIWTLNINGLAAFGQGCQYLNHSKITNKCQVKAKFDVFDSLSLRIVLDKRRVINVVGQPEHNAKDDGFSDTNIKTPALQANIHEACRTSIFSRYLFRAKSLRLITGINYWSSGGATFNSSSIVVVPAATFSAPFTINGCMPSW